mmetsp:Transcript_6058/g.16967  ORF Transcript_6058/g.16967 Transcript_6058/m.16967 type:complete len:517 (+) Transcript_6058:59-1609(+)
MSSAVEEASSAAAVASQTGAGTDKTHADDAQIPVTPLKYRNNATLIAPVRVDVTASPDMRDRQIARAVRLIRPDLFFTDRPSHTYASVSHAHRITIRQLGGGLSNHLYVAHPGGREEAVLVRIHAEDEDGVAVADDDGTDASASPSLPEPQPASSEAAATFVDREVENRILAWLSSEGLAPIFHGRFVKGRIEEFYDGYRPLSWDELHLASFAVPVARALANLHCAHPPEGVLNSSEEQRREGEIWSHVSDWFDMASRASPDVAEADELLQTMKLEWEWLQASLRHPSDGATASADTRRFDLRPDSIDMRSAASSYFREIVFTHMDCQSLNILTPCDGFHLDDSSDPDSDSGSDSTNDKEIDAEQKLEKRGQDDEKGGEYASVRLIDFEYSGLNPRGADIANTFCEHCNMNNLEPNYGEQYPTDKQQDTFLRAYIAKASPELAKKLDQQLGNGEEDGWEPFLATARVQVGRYALLSHIGWSIWAVAQANLSTIEFDYLKYARLRLEGYFHFKDRFW